VLLFRFVVFFLLLAAGVSFAFYIGIGQIRFRLYGVRLLKWAVMAGLGFFGVLVLERIV
jgi:hypothetical protein